ncbi:MAG: hypothetical protein JXA82_00560 [Sedimentisphaerales bacterium]|nr:hypothetical protein [Sedimentisphaerales bacterium]
MKRIGLIILSGILLWSTFVDVSRGQTAIAETASTEKTAPSESDLQLRVLRTALFQGPTDQNRLDAVLVLLARQDREARAVLLSALIAKDTPAARRAVCLGLIRHRGLIGNIANRDDFLEPLLGMLMTDSPEEVRLASEALLVFEFDQISTRLTKLAQSTDLEAQIRVNAMYALQLWPEKEVVSVLIGLLEDPDREVATASRKALVDAFGIPATVDPKTLRGIVTQLQAKSTSQIMRDLMLVQRDQAAFQSERMRRIEAERDLWRQRYLAVLDRDYIGADEATKGKILIEKLGSELTAEKQWALRKVPGFPGTITPEMRVLLLAAVSDPDREVRIDAARVLAGKSALDPAETLLNQLKQERDKEVGLAIFSALGEACFFAFSPGSPIKLDSSIRDETLNRAATYLNSSDPLVASLGAEVIAKLMGLNSLTPEKAETYLKMMAERYVKARNQTEKIKAPLLSSMAGLASVPGYKAKASEISRPLFVEALESPDSANGIREAAATGLVALDKSAALKLFREKNLAADNSAAVRRIMIGVTGEAGDASDLDWLAKKLAANGDAEPAWQAFLAIMNRQGANAVYTWASQLAEGGSNATQYRELLNLAATKADAEKNENLAAQVRLLLLEIHLKAADVPKVSGVMAWRLLQQKDIVADDPFITKVEAWLATPDVDSDKKTTLIQTLAGVKKPEGAEWPNWTAKLKGWEEKFIPKSDTNTTNPPASQVSTS